MLLVYKITARFVSASTVVSRRVCSQLPSRSVCGHSTIVAWCVRVVQQSSSLSPQTTIVGPTKVAWCMPSLSGWEKFIGAKFQRPTADADRNLENLVAEEDDLGYDQRLRINERPLTFDDAPKGWVAAKFNSISMLRRTGSVSQGFMQWQSDGV